MAKLAPIIVMTLSNKPDLLPQARASVEAQSVAQGRMVTHVVGIDGPDWEWPSNVYPPAMYYNRTAHKAKANAYVIWLSDDDLLLPGALEAMASYLDNHPQAQAVYGGARHVALQDGEETFIRDLPVIPVGRYDGNYDPMGQIDGGQVMVRRSALDMMSYPYTPEAADGSERVNDGTLLRRMAQVFGIDRLDPWRQIAVCRSTPKSAHTVPTGGAGVEFADWRRNAQV